MERNIKDLFSSDSVDKQIQISYDGGILGNNQILSESMELEEILCSEDRLMFGCCCASTLKVTILNHVALLNGKSINVSCTIEGTDEAYVLGSYKVDSDKPTADRRYRDIIAYDAMYDIIHAEVSDWYNGLTFPLTLKAFRDSFFTWFGITQENVTLVNDSMTVEETIRPGELSGQTVIQSICEINGCFGHIRRDGTFEYRFLPEIIGGLYPANDLYPRDSLYPRQSNTLPISGNTYTRCRYEDYVCRRISKLQIRQEENDIGAITGAGNNCYIIEDNFLVYGKGAEELGTIAENLFTVIQKVRYRPFEAEAKGNPCIEVGDAIRIHTANAVIESYVLRRTLKGIQALKDSYTAEGEENCAENVNSVNRSIIQLRGKTNILTRTVEETRLEIQDIEKGLSSRILQTAEQIQTEVLRATESEWKLSSRITQTAESITAEIKRATDTENSLSSKITQTAEIIASEVMRATGAEGQLSSKITQTAESISSEVTRATNAESSLSSKINQTAEQIELKVTKGEISSQLSMESGQITIKSNRFVLESTNCSISRDGTLTAKNADFSGKITANSGLIGGMTLSSNGLYNGKSSPHSSLSGVYFGVDGISLGPGSSSGTPSFYVSPNGEVKIGYSGGLSMKSDIVFSATAVIRYGMSDAIRFSPDGIVVGGYGGKLGFFSAVNTGSIKKSVTSISSTGSVTATAVATKLNELLTALKAYNLIG